MSVMYRGYTADAKALRKEARERKEQADCAPSARAREQALGVAHALEWCGKALLSRHPHNALAAYQSGYLIDAIREQAFPTRLKIFFRDLDE